MPQSAQQQFIPRWRANPQAIPRWPGSPQRHTEHVEAPGERVNTRVASGTAIRLMPIRSAWNEQICREYAEHDGRIPLRR